MYRGYLAIATPVEDLTQDQVDWLYLDALIRPGVHKNVPRREDMKPRMLNQLSRDVWYPTAWRQRDEDFMTACAPPTRW